MDKTVFTFNTYFYDLVKDVKRVSSELKAELKKHYTFMDCQCGDNLAAFNAQMTDGLLQKVMLLSDTDLFTEPDMLAFELFKGITVERMQGALGSTTDLKWYVYALTLFNYMHNMPDETSDKLYLSVMECIGKIQKKEKYEAVSKQILDDEVCTLLDKIAATSSPKKDVQEAVAKESGINFDPSLLENSTIGSLAKEIASELDLGNLKVDKPEDLLNFGGENNFIGNIVGKIGNKVNAKLESGELKHDDLLGEAMGLLKSLGGNGGLGSFLNNPMFKEMMSGKAKVNEEKLRHASTRDRLKKKLEKRNE